MQFSLFNEGVLKACNVDFEKVTNRPLRPGMKVRHCGAEALHHT